eukprot:IDg3933t1
MRIATNADSLRSRFAGRRHHVPVNPRSMIAALRLRCGAGTPFALCGGNCCQVSPLAVEAVASIQGGLSRRIFHTKFSLIYSILFHDTPRSLHAFPTYHTAPVFFSKRLSSPASV